VLNGCSAAIDDGGSDGQVCCPPPNITRMLASCQVRGWVHEALGSCRHTMRSRVPSAFAASITCRL